MAQAPITVHLDPDAQARLAELAYARQQPVAEVAAEVLASYVAPESWEQRRIRSSMEALKSGKGIPHEEVTLWLDSWGTDQELPAPR
ncbi:CopG family ribbon-helix-helix protein [Telmatobacter bradus]|uniref:CopG family ribbon-helix-helix protein n=1 Tax=Telmatobacter bradus TaxID=474953 RepID=UPI003B42FAAF